MVGANAGAMQMGGIAGAIPAGVAAARWGLSRSLSWSLAALAMVSMLRVIVTAPALLLVLAFIGGMLAASWMVCIAPVIAELAPERYRPFLFSVFFSTGIGVGVLGGIVAGQLPGIAMSVGTPASYAKPASLLLGCTLIGVGAAMLSRLRLQRRHSEQPKLYPKNPLLWRFLIVIGMFSLGTGAFNSLYSVFLASVAKLSVERIGAVFAVSQMAQVVAIMLGGTTVQKLGWTFAGTAAALFWLGFEPTGLAAAAAYVLYMSFQYMSQPGIFSMLMSIATPAEHKGASTLNFVVINGGQAAAAFAAGAAVTKWGYSPVLGVAAAVILVAALLFPLLTRNCIASTTSAR
jgi:predicted MFS family arabinose efflux permease